MANPVQSLSLMDATRELRELGQTIEVRNLHQKLQASRTLNHEYEVLISSLFTTLKKVLNGVCPTCKAIVEKCAPSHFATVADVVEPAGRPRLSDKSSNSHFSRWIFKARRTGSLLCPTAEPAISHAVYLKSILSPVPFKQLITQTRTHSSPSRAVLKTSRPKGVEKLKHHGWSVEINKVKPSLNVCFEKVKFFEGSVACVKFSCTGSYLAAGINKKGGGWRVRIYDMKTVNLNRKFALRDRSETKSKSLWSICFSPNDQYLAIADSDMQLQIWEIKKNLLRAVLKGHTKRVTSVDFSPNGRFLASSSKDRTVRIWSMRDGFSRVLEDDAQPYFQVRFSPNGKYLAAADDDGMLRMWNARTGRLVMRWRDSDDNDVVRGFAFRPDGMGFLSAGPDYTCYRSMTNLLESAEPSLMQKQSDKNKEILKLGTQADNGVCLNYSPNGQWFAYTPSHDLPLYISDTTGKHFELQCIIRGKQILSTDFSPMGELLALGSADGQLSLWKYGATSSVSLNKVL